MRVRNTSASVQPPHKAVFAVSVASGNALWHQAPEVVIQMEEKNYHWSGSKLFFQPLSMSPSEFHL